jgi:uncharacterized membrane protein
VSRPLDDPDDRRLVADLDRLRSARPVDAFDTPAEVDATFRTQRRIAVGYFVVFLLVTLAVPALTLVLEWWSQGRLAGGMSPYFVMAAAGLYVFFFVLALAAATLSSAVEDRMLGGPDWPADEPEDTANPSDARRSRDSRR